MASGTENESKTSLSLIERTVLNEPHAWERFVDLYAPLVDEWVRQRRIDANTSADIVQDVFASVHRSLAKFSHDGGTFRGWLWTITRNKILDHVRRESRHANAQGGSTAMLKINSVPDDRDLPESDPTTAQSHTALVHRAVSQVQGEFEPRTWQAFWRTTIDGIATDLVATELGMKPATVRQSKSRVLRRLRTQLGEP